MKSETRHLALYRKYRPQKFEEVFGQEEAIKILKNSIQENKISHAYLFSGDRGVGKTTVARILAREIGCQAEDIFEIDAASHNGVEEMREIIEATRASTFGSKYKIYILDEAHMLSKSAANSFLKTLEEPPEHVIFVLATTDPNKLPDTIISRCQIINFISPSLEILEKNLKFIGQQEKIEIEHPGLELIASLGHGSFRDAVGILEKVIQATSLKTITFTDVKKVLGIIDQEEILKIMEAIGQKDIPKILEIIRSLNLNTKQKLEKFYIDLIKMFELTLLLRIDNKSEKIYCATFNLSVIQIAKLKELGLNCPQIISAASLLELLEIESRLANSSLLKETVLVTGLIKLLTS